MNKERPIIFNDEMVRAILEGRKTQTRRLVKPQPVYPGVSKYVFLLHPFAPSTFKGTIAEGMKQIAPENKVWCEEDWCGNIVGVYGDCPYGKVGDRLLASRITLEITDVRVERIQDISEEDAYSEGTDDWCGEYLDKKFGKNGGSKFCNIIEGFKFMWNSIYPNSLERNDWVWVIGFKRINPI